MDETKPSFISTPDPRILASLIGSLRNHDGNANENATWKYKFA